MIPEVCILPDAEALAEAAAERIIEICSQAIHSRKMAYLALAGGSTPHAAYSLLAQPEYAACIEWGRVQVFWSDERLVPPDHIDSNYRVAAEALVSQVPLPSENLHRMRGELPPDRAAQEYEDEIRNCLPVDKDGFPSFDLMMIGMGDDGHIASMFPGSPALLERKRWVVACEHERPPLPLVPRLTLTLPVINAAALVMLIVSGEQKADRLRQVLEDEPGSQPLPAQLVNPQGGGLLFLLDREAASRLKRL